MITAQIFLMIIGGVVSLLGFAWVLFELVTRVINQVVNHFKFFELLLDYFKNRDLYKKWKKRGKP